MVAGSALLITVATYVAFPDSFIFFGILHNIAAASLVGLLFLRAPAAVTLLAAAAAFILPQYVQSELFNVKWLAWIGFSTFPPRSNDYVPLLPWLAPFLAVLPSPCSSRRAAGWTVFVSPVRHAISSPAPGGIASPSTSSTSRC